ncbi:glycoside hydrolase family 5 protein, partial [Tulasnella calospora MUT 4182]
CAEWNDWQSWTQDRKDDFRAFALRNFDALGHWFFWTWKIGASSLTGKVETPMWSYQLGLEQGWIPADPSEAVGTCGNTSPAQPLTPQMIGAAGTGEITAAYKAQFPWPPTTVLPALNPDNVRAYTATGPIPTLPVPTGASPTVDGWFDAADNRPIYTPVAGCTYPDAWGSADGTNPGPCGGASGADDPVVTTRRTTTTDEALATDEPTDTTTTDDGEATTTDEELRRRVRRVRRGIPMPKRTPAP